MAVTVGRLLLDYLSGREPDPTQPDTCMPGCAVCLGDGFSPKLARGARWADIMRQEQP